MIWDLVIFGLLAGLDNLQVCSSLGLLPMQRSRLHQQAAAFCFCEIAGALVGLIIGHALLATFDDVTSKLAPLFVLGCGAAVLYLGIRRDDLDRLVNGRTMLFGLPLTLSLDNVVAGAGISFSAYPLVAAVLIVGGISAAMSCLGLYFGGWLRRFLPARTELLAGGYLCFLALRMALLDGK